ncbi:hypothetical protein [Novipirellula maiorica]|nr:hypothetical protein [Rhodopirellula maiorica]
MFHFLVAVATAGDSPGRQSEDDPTHNPSREATLGKASPGS